MLTIQVLSPHYLFFYSTLSSDIASAIRQDHGIAVVLSATAQAFDHHTANVHDGNIGLGAIPSLLHALDHVSRKIRVSQSPLGSTNEAKTLLIAAAAAVSALEMSTTRCSNEVLEYFVRRNCNDLLPSLASLLTIFSAADSESSVVQHVLLQKTTNTIAAMSSANLSDIEIHPQAVNQCCSALIIALQNEGPGLIRRNCIAVLLNFSRSTDQARDNMLLSTGLLDTLISLIRSDAIECTSRGLENEIVSILLNLSVSGGDNMARNEDLQLLLIDLMTESSSSFIISTAALILQNVFQSLENPTLFCSDDDLVTALVGGIDGGGTMGQMTCVRLLERFLQNAIISKESTNQVDLVAAVSSLALEEEKTSNQHLGVSTGASHLLPILSQSFLFDGSSSSKKILNNLIDLSRSDYSSRHAAEAFLNLSRIPVNKGFLASCADNSLFSCLTSFALRDNTAHMTLETIYNLCNCSEGQRYAIRSDNRVSTLLLDIISGTIEVSDAAYAYSVKAIKCLASHPPNQKRLAKYRYVVPTLIALAARSPCSPDTKEAAIEAIVLLSRTAILV